MDEVKAKEWEVRFRGQQIEGWTVEALIDHGKSAAVFKAVNGSNGNLAALKIFDDELIKRYGDESQLKRIGRELSLIGKQHPNMVNILGGGLDATSNNHYIIMQYLDGPSLNKCLAKVPDGNIPRLIEQLVSACEFLEANDLAHRDIKPANIVLLEEMSHLVLLDFGVLKPVGEAGLTDVDGQRLFVGTLQYSSPEFLLRKEEDSKIGWHGLAIYQVGAVLHDLIMHRPIFDEFVNPYAALVNAVQHEQPSVASSAVPSYLVDACRMALVKDPERRIKLVEWDGFRPPVAKSVADDARQRIGKRLLLAETQTKPSIDEGPASAELLETVVEGLKIELRRIRQANSSIMPPLIVTRGPNRKPVLHIKMTASEEFALMSDVNMDIVVSVIDVDSQAVQLQAKVFAGTALPVEPLEATNIFRGPYNSSAVSENIEAAMFVALDHAQSGVMGPISLTSVGVE